MIASRGIAVFSCIALMGIGLLQAVRAQDGKENGGEAKDAATVLMTCTVHGDDAMTLKFVVEEGDPRSIEVIGTASGARWTVKIDGVDATPATQTARAPGQIKIRKGDKFAFTVTGSEHGIVFPTQAAAEAIFEFDAMESKPLGASTAVPGYKWGTAGFRPTTKLAVAVVR